MFCNACGAEIPEGSRFCPRCGRPVGQAGGVGGTPTSASAPTAMPAQGSLDGVWRQPGMAGGAELDIMGKIVWFRSVDQAGGPTALRGRVFSDSTKSNGEGTASLWFYAFDGIKDAFLRVDGMGNMTFSAKNDGTFFQQAGAAKKIEVALSRTGESLPMSVYDGAFTSVASKKDATLLGISDGVVQYCVQTPEGKMTHLTGTLSQNGDSVNFENGEIALLSDRSGTKITLTFRGTATTLSEVMSALQMK